MLANRPSGLMRTLAPVSSMIAVGVLDQYPVSPGTTPRRTCPSGQRGVDLAGCDAFRNGDGAALSFLPFASVTILALACLLPSRARDASIVTASPTFVESWVQPSRLSSMRLGNSTAQFVMLPPAGSATSTKRNTCGLVQSNFVTTPFSVTGFLSS